MIIAVGGITEHYQEQRKYIEKYYQPKLKQKLKQDIKKDFGKILDNEIAKLNINIII